jgi:hypothetical protein
MPVSTYSGSTFFKASFSVAVSGILSEAGGGGGTVLVILCSQAVSRKSSERRRVIRAKMGVPGRGQEKRHAY